MNDHPRWFVHDYEIVIYTKQFKRQIFGLGDRRRPRQHVNLYLFASRDPVRNLRGVAVHMHASFTNQFLDSRTAQLRHAFGEKQIKPPPRISRGGGECLVCRRTRFSLPVRQTGLSVFLLGVQSRKISARGSQCEATTRQAEARLRQAGVSYWAADGRRRCRRTPKSSSKRTSTAPIVMAESAALNAGQRYVPSRTSRKSVTPP